MSRNWLDNQTSSDKSTQDSIRNAGILPRHIAIIMDGNGRWAVEGGKNRTAGHEEGINSVRDIVKASSQLGVQYLTLYAFSMENWKRPRTEVNILMKLLEFYLKQEIEELHQNNVRLLAIGKINALPKSIQKLLLHSIERTKENTGLTLTLALSYSGRWDIVRAVQMIALDVRRGKLSPEDITEERFASYLVTHNVPDPDLLIRTSGEMRLSNFLLWETAYAEIYITERYWPAFRREDLYHAVNNFMCRERRFGKTSAQVLTEQPDTNSPKNYFQRVMDAFNPR